MPSAFEIKVEKEKHYVDLQQQAIKELEAQNMDVKSFLEEQASIQGNLRYLNADAVLAFFLNKMETAGQAKNLSRETLDKLRMVWRAVFRLNLEKFLGQGGMSTVMNEDEPGNTEDKATVKKLAEHTKDLMLKLIVGQGGAKRHQQDAAMNDEVLSEAAQSVNPGNNYAYMFYTLEKLLSLGHRITLQN